MKKIAAALKPRPAWGILMPTMLSCQRWPRSLYAAAALLVAIGATPRLVHAEVTVVTIALPGEAAGDRDATSLDLIRERVAPVGAVGLDGFAVSSLQLRGIPGVPADFNPTQGHCPFVRNPNLPGETQDRLYIPAFDGWLLILDVTASYRQFPQFVQLVEDPALAGLHVQDLVAAPVNEAFLGSDLARNVIFGIASDAQGFTGGKLLLLEDRGDV